MVANGRAIGIIRLIGVAMVVLSLAGCTDDKPPWRLDVEYSEYLTTTASTYKIMTGLDSGDTADALQVYSIRQKHGDMYSLSELFKKRLMFETKDKKLIRHLLLSAQEAITHVPGCVRDPGEIEVLHVVVFDNTFMRAGYFTVARCNVEGQEYGIIHNLRNAGLYYNKKLLPAFRKHFYIEN